MINLLMPRKSRPIKVAALVNRVADAVRSVVAPQSLFTTAPAPAAVEPETDETKFFTEADMPAVEDIEQACAEFFRAADAGRAAERTKRRTRKTLDRLRSGRYAGWELERVESSRQVADLDAIKRIFRLNGLGEIPMKSASPSLKVRKVELDLNAAAVEAELTVLAGAR